MKPIAGVTAGIILTPSEKAPIHMGPRRAPRKRMVVAMALVTALVKALVKTSATAIAMEIERAVQKVAQMATDQIAPMEEVPTVTAMPSRVARVAEIQRAIPGRSREIRKASESGPGAGYLHLVRL